MLGRLFVKECTQTAKSLIYWLVVLVIALFFFSQTGDITIDAKPKPGQDEYGAKYSTDKNVVMQETLGKLAEEYYQGKYTTYPIGFAKTVTLNKEEEKRVGEIVKETTGLDKEQIEQKMNEFYQGRDVIYLGMPLEPSENLTFKRFKTLMNEVDEMLGGESSYEGDFKKSRALVPMTYEDALEEYNVMIEKDHVSGAAARLFSDYMVIVLGFAPVFLAVTRELRDRRAGMQELIYSRKASAAAVIGSRYLSMVFMIMIPVLLLSLLPLTECMIYGQETGITIDYLAFVKYSFGWLLPTVMAVTAAGMFFTELTDTALGVLVQGAWWYITLFVGRAAMQGGEYGWLLMPRHNTTGNYDGFKDGFAQLAANRITYVIAAFIITALTAWIYAQKRKGRLDIHGKIFANRKGKSKA